MRAARTNRGRKHSHNDAASRKRRSHGTRSRRLRFEALEQRLLLDGAGPRILSYSPDEVRNGTFDYIEVTFDEPIDTTTFTLDDVTIDGPTGAIEPSAVAQQTPERFRVSFPALTVRGTYTAAIGPDIADMAGNLLDQNQDDVGGDASDAYSASLVYIDATVTFASPITISAGDTTYESDDLLVDGTTVTLDGPHRFNSIHLVNGAVLTHTANSTTETHKLDLQIAEQVIVDSTSRIDVTGKGYFDKHTTGNTTEGGVIGYAVRS